MKPLRKFSELLIPSRPFCIPFSLVVKLVSLSHTFVTLDGALVHFVTSSSEMPFETRQVKSESERENEIFRHLWLSIESPSIKAGADDTLDSAPPALYQELAS